MHRPIDDFHDYLMHDVFSAFSGITSKRMFGGYGIYQDDAIFAIITDTSELYFKVDDTNRAQFGQYDSEPFIYTGHKNRKPTAMPYWKLPEEILEDREKLEEWIAQSATITKKQKK